MTPNSTDKSDGSGTSKTDKTSPKDSVAKLPSFISAKNLKPFISEELDASLIDPIEFLPKAGRSAYGFRAELVPQICAVWSSAKDAGVLQERQKRTADIANILLRGLANTGIIALVDEATGYQYDNEFRVPCATMTISMGRLPGSLLVNRIRTLGQEVLGLSAVTEGEVTKLEISGVADDDEKDVFDLLAYRMVELANVDENKNRRTTYKRRRPHVLAAWERRRPELGRLYD